jgi:hypothetical protein
MAQTRGDQPAERPSQPGMRQGSRRTFLLGGHTVAKKKAAKKKAAPKKKAAKKKAAKKTTKKTAKKK